MTQPTQPDYGSLSPGGTGQGGSDASVKDKAAQSAQAGTQAAAEVAQTATGQAKQVAAEAQSQARDLVGEARNQLRSHAGDQHRNAVTSLRSLGDELRSMASNSEQNGVATDLVRQAADRTHGVADWLDNREPGDLLDELRRVARGRPGTFLLGALAAGVVAGRVTRGAVAAHSQDNASGDDASLAEPVDTAGYAGSRGEPIGTGQYSGQYSELPYRPEPAGQPYPATGQPYPAAGEPYTTGSAGGPA